MSHLPATQERFRQEMIIDRRSPIPVRAATGRLGECEKAPSPPRGNSPTARVKRAAEWRNIQYAHQWVKWYFPLSGRYATHDSNVAILKLDA